MWEQSPFLQARHCRGALDQECRLAGDFLALGNTVLGAERYMLPTTPDPMKAVLRTFASSGISGLLFVALLDCAVAQVCDSHKYLRQSKHGHCLKRPWSDTIRAGADHDPLRWP
jgi:hypothetical protein